MMPLDLLISRNKCIHAVTRLVDTVYQYNLLSLGLRILRNNAYILSPDLRISRTNAYMLSILSPYLRISRTNAYMQSPYLLISCRLVGRMIGFQLRLIPSTARVISWNVTGLERVLYREPSRECACRYVLHPLSLSDVRSSFLQPGPIDERMACVHYLRTGMVCSLPLPCH